MKTRDTFQDWAELLPQVAFEIDIEGKVTYTNERGFDTFGYTHEDFDQGMNALQMFAPKDRDRTQETITRLLNGERITELDLTAVRKDGQQFPVIAYGAPITENEQIIGVRGFLVNISERKQTEDALMESEFKYRTIFENANDEIVYLDESGTVIEVNKRIEDIFGWKPEEVIGKNFTELPFLEPQNIQIIRQEFHKGIYSGEEILTTYDAQKKDGNPVSVEASTRIIQLEDGTKRSLVIVRDITERKQAIKELQQKKEYFRSLIENASDGIVIINGDMAISYYSPSAEQILGVNANDRLGRSALELIHPDELMMAARAFTQLLQEPGKMARAEVRGRHSDGSWRVLEITGHNQLDNPAVNGIVANFSDITDRRKAEEEVKFRSAFESLITTISTKFINLSHEEIDSEITEALRLIGEFADVDRCYVFEYSEDGSTISNSHEWCAEGIEAQIENLQNMPADEPSWMMDNLALGDVIHIPNVADLPEEAALDKEILEAQGIQSLIMVPMICGRNPLGCVGFDSVRIQREWSDDGIRLLQMAGQILANALARMHAEQIIHQNEQQFREIFENASDEIVYMDETGTVIKVNGRVYDIFGYRPDEIIGRKFLDIDFLDPQGMAAMINRFSEALFTEATDLISFEAKRRDGNPVFVEASTRLVEGDGHTKRILVIIRDVTQRKKAEIALQKAYDKVEERVKERTAELAETNVQLTQEMAVREQVEKALRESEEKYRMLVENSATPITYYGIDGRIMFVNEIGAKNLGGIPENFIGRPITEVLPELADTITSRIRHIAESRVGDDYETLVHLPTGDRWFYSNLQPMTDANDNIFAIQAVSQDITERKKTEQALQNSEERFRSIIENSHDVIVLVSPEGQTLYASPSIERITGYTADEREMNPFWELIHPDDMAAVTENFNKILSAPGATESIELRLKRKDGELRWVAGTGKNFLDNPILHAIVCNYSDITERKLAEEALRESELKFREMSNLLPQIVFEIDDQANFTFINEHIYDSFGYSVAEVMADFDIFQLLASEDTARAQENMLKIFNSKQGLTIEYTGVRKDGSTFPLISYVNPIIKDNRSVGLRGIVVDITERKLAEEALRESEQKYSTLVANAYDGVAIIQDESYKFVNPAWAQTTGYSIPELMEMSIADVLTPEYADLVMERYKSRITGTAPPPVYEIEIRRKDGAIRNVELSASVIEYEGKPADMAILRDITERKQAEQILKETLDRIRKLNEAAFEGIIVTEQGIIIDANPSFASMYGYEPDEVIGQKTLDLVAPESREIVSQKISEQFLGRYEAKAMKKKGTIFDVEVCGTMANFGGRNVRITAIHDVSERKQAENALRESEEKYRKLIEDFDHPIWVFDREGIVQVANPTAAKYLGGKPEDFIGRSIAKYSPERAAMLLERNRLAIESGLSASYEDMFELPTGQKWFWSNLQPVRDTSDNITGIQTISYDITKRKETEKALRESEEKWQALVDNALAIILTISPDGTILSINQTLTEKDREEVIGTNCLNYVQAKDQAQVKKLINKVFESGRPQQGETAVTLPGNPIAWMDISVTPIKDHEKVVAAIYMATDISDRKRSEAQLQQYSTELQAVNKELARYAEVASHDICTPLRAIRYYTHLLRKEPKGASLQKRHSYLNTIDTAVHEGEELAKNLLELSYLGQNEIRLEKIDVGDLLRKVIISSGLSDDTGIVLKKKWPTIMTDSTLLSQIFRNLIDNAVKFRSDPDGRIELSWKTLDDQGYEFSVRDYGIGIDPIHHEDIFQIFKQLHHKEEYQGTGIGLAIVKKAAGRLDGSVRLKSKLGKGSSFLFTIPKYDPPNQSEQKTSQKTRKKGSSTVRSKRRS